MRPSKGLFWIPDALPAHVHLVTSCTFGDIEKNIAAKKYEQMVIYPLESEKECKQFIDDYLKLYRKKLDRKNKKKIIKSPQAWLPVYMRTLLEEIRLHGDHKTLGRKIEAYLEAKTPVELFKYVLSRYEQDYEKENPGLVRKIMSFIWASRRGLLESELLGLTGKTFDRPLPQFYWAQLFLACRNFLVNSSGYIHFSHEYFSKAVQEKYLTRPQAAGDVHSCLARYFGQVSFGSRRIEEYPWQLMCAKNRDKLAHLLKDLDFFMAAFAFNEFDLYRYWTALKKNQPINLRLVFASVFEHPKFHRRYLHRLARLFLNLGYPDESGELQDCLMGLSIHQGNARDLIPSLIEKTNIYKRKNQFIKAEGELENAEALCRDLNDKDNLSRVLGHQADILAARIQTQRALAKVDEALEIATALENKYMIQHLWAIKSAVFDSAGDFDKALEFSAKALKLCQEIQDDASVLSLLWDQATILKKKSDFSQAFFLYEKCIKEADTLGNDPMVAKSLIGQSDLLVFQGKLGPAQKILDRALSLSDRTKDWQNMADALVKKSGILQNQGHLDQALTLLETAQDLYAGNGLKKDIVSCYNARSLILNAQHRYEESLGLLEKAEFICRELGLNDGLQTVIGNKAMIFRAFKRFDEALALYREKERICRQTGNKKSLAICLGNMGNIYYELKDCEKAIELNRQKAEIAYEIGNLKSYANALGNQAGILIESGRKDHALEISREHEKICTQINDPKGLCQSLTNKTLIYFQFKKFGPALENCNRALITLEKYPSPPGARQFLQKIKADIEQEI